MPKQANVVASDSRPALSYTCKKCEQRGVWLPLTGQTNLRTMKCVQRACWEVLSFAVRDERKFREPR
jgi:hypothetical protein